MKTLKITTDNKISIIDLDFDHKSLREEVGGYSCEESSDESDGMLFLRHGQTWESYCRRCDLRPAGWIRYACYRVR